MIAVVGSYGYYLWIVSDSALRRTPIALLYFRWCDHKAIIAHSSC